MRISAKAFGGGVHPNTESGAYLKLPWISEYGRSFGGNSRTATSPSEYATVADARKSVRLASSLRMGIERPGNSLGGDPGTWGRELRHGENQHHPGLLRKGLVACVLTDAVNRYEMTAPRRANDAAPLLRLAESVPNAKFGMMKTASDR